MSCGAHSQLELPETVGKAVPQKPGIWGPPERAHACGHPERVSAAGGSGIRRSMTALVALALLAGCAAGGERTLPAPVAGSPVSEGMARLSVTRTNDILFLGLSADVTVNDQSAGSIFRGQSTAVEVPAGLATVAVTAFGSPGRFVLRFPTVSGGRYDLQVVPRGASFAPAMMLGYVGSMMDAAANPERGGSFTLAIVSATPPIGTPAPSPAPPSVVATAADREDRLAELWRLRNRGLITDDVYREEQRRALAPMTSPPPR